MSQNVFVQKLFSQKHNNVLIEDWDQYRKGKLLAKFFYNDSIITPNLILLFVDFLKEGSVGFDLNQINSINQNFHSFDDLDFLAIRNNIKTIAISHGFVFVLGE